MQLGPRAQVAFNEACGASDERTEEIAWLLVC